MPIQSKLAPLEFPEVALHQALMPMLQVHGDKVAVIDGVDHRQFTFNEVAQKIRQVASGLHRLGVRKGDIVAIFSPNSPEWIFMFFGILINGATVTTVNPTYTLYELTHNLKDSGTSYIFTVDPLKKLVTKASADSGCVKKVIIHGRDTAGCVDFSSILKDDGSACPDDVPINPREDVATIPYSSGTTGLPKGVMITHFNLVAQLLQLGHDEFKTPEQLDGSADQLIMIAFLPFFHAYGMVGIMIGGLFGGSTMITLPRFHVEQFLATIEKYKVNALPLVPPVVVALNSSPLVKKYDVSSVKYVNSGAAPLAKDQEEEFMNKLGVGELKQGFGMTETTICTTRHKPTGKSKPGSCGVLLSNIEMKVIDPGTGKELGRNERGEVCFRGPNIMKGYLNRPEATANTIIDGWLHTGDIGYYDEDDNLYIVDRLKELIKYKGFQVAPAELEALLLNHPKVSDVGVIGVPDKQAGELPRAFVVKSAGASVTEEEIQAYVAERLSNFKHLRGGVEFMDEIPKSQSGKILRRQLRDMMKKRTTSKL